VSVSELPFSNHALLGGVQGGLTSLDPLMVLSDYQIEERNVEPSLPESSRPSGAQSPPPPPTPTTHVTEDSNPFACRKSKHDSKLTFSARFLWSGLSL